MQKLLTEALEALKAGGLKQVGENHPPIYVPSSNGAIEVACKIVGGMVRALKSDLEARVNRVISCDASFIRMDDGVCGMVDDYQAGTRQREVAEPDGPRVAAPDGSTMGGHRTEVATGRCCVSVR